MHTSATSIPNGSVDPTVNHHIRYAVTEPVRPVKAEVCCDHCRAAKEGANTLRRLQTGALQLIYALTIIVGAVFRIARLLIAGTLTMFGILGTLMYLLGQRIVHPDDSRLLPLLPETQSER